MDRLLLRPESKEELQRDVCDHKALLVRGGGSKPGLLAQPADVVSLDVSALSGIVEYVPEEFTFTALAGTPVASVVRVLREHGQYLPFDPVLVERGATLGGTVAAGTAGPGRYRYGGVRDFVLGVQFVDGTGRLVRAGGKVVKNAAGFDIPKLMVGSLGGLGVLVEITFKVFPEPEAFGTVRLDSPNLEEALDAFYRVYTSPLEVHALDLVPGTGSGYELWVRLGGMRAGLLERMERLRGMIGGQVITGDVETAVWQAARELAWVPVGWSLAKVALSPGQIAALETELARIDCLRRYSAGGQVAWIATPEPPATLHPLLVSRQLAGVALFGASFGPRRLGERPGESFARRVKAALDPEGRFVEV